MSREIFDFDNSIRKKFKTENLCGVDEVGRGSIAGPLVAASVVFSSKNYISQLKESKSVCAKKRKILFKEILNTAKDISCCIVSTKCVNKEGLGQANIIALKSAVEKLDTDFRIVVVDGYKINNLDKKQIPLIKGDQKSAVVAAASIIAKVIRDTIMEFYDKIIPEYNFCKNKGYATKNHRKIVSFLGLSELHRKYAYKFIS